jgi:hypothetical protein
VNIQHSPAPHDEGALCDIRIRENIAKCADDVTCKRCRAWPSLMRDAFRVRLLIQAAVELATRGANRS